MFQAGYAVVFLNRRHSIQPFTKGLPSGQILDFLTDVLEPDAGATTSNALVHLLHSFYCPLTFLSPVSISSSLHLHRMSAFNSRTCT